MKKLLKFLTGNKVFPAKPIQQTKFQLPHANDVIAAVPEVKVNGIDRRWRLSKRGLDHGNGHKVTSEYFYDYYDGGNYYLGDNAIIKGGRTIYTSPKGNDTLYWNTPTKEIWYSHGLMPVGGNLPGAKRNFFKNLKRPLVKEQEGGTIDEPSGKFNNALFNLGIGAADSGLFASMLHKDGGVLKGQKGLEAKSDNTRVSKIPNNGEAIYRNPEDENWALDFVPILGTIRAAERYDHNGHLGNLADAGISGAMDLLGAKMLGAVVKAAGKASRIHKALKSVGFKQVGPEPTKFIKPALRASASFTPSENAAFLRGATKTTGISPTYITKNIPNVDYTNVAMLPLIQSLRVPFEAPFKYSAYLK